MNKILCIGEALIDMICTDKGKTLAAGDNFLKKTGGAPTNVAAAIAALGGAVDLAAKVGNDPFGSQLIDVMNEFGVGTQWMLRDPAAFTTLAFVSLMENGERDFVFSRGADGNLSEADLNGLQLNDYAVLHFGSATGFLPGPLKEAYVSLLHKALQQDLFVSFDPNYRHLLFKDNTETFITQSWYFIEKCHFFKVSDEEAILLTGASSIEEAALLFRKRTKAVFAITLGKDGTLIGLNDTTFTIKSIPIQAVDTTGAGDAFVGALLYQLSKLSVAEMQSASRWQWEQLTINANKAGARTCEYLGAMEAFKHLNNSIFN